jgi:hypothetical protein
MPAPTISDLPAAPSRSDPATFSDRADTFVAALATFKTELNAYANYMDNLAILADGGLYEVQSSNTDVTSGRLLKVNAFGVGGVDYAPQITDFGAEIASGFYRYLGGASGAVNSPDTAAWNGSCVVMDFMVGRTTFLAVRESASTPKMWFGAKPNGASSVTWLELYSRDNAVGAVSQVGGEPTGAVVERGSNANGEYVRFADGTQICWKTIDIPSLDINTATGNVFVSASQLLGSTAASFLTTPAFSFSTSVLNAYSWCASGGLGAPTSFPQVQFFRSTAVTGRAARICATAVGRWF